MPPTIAIPPLATFDIAAFVVVAAGAAAVVGLDPEENEAVVLLAVV